MTTSKSGGGEHIDDVLDCFVGAVVGEFELAVWAVFEVRLVVEAAVGPACTGEGSGKTNGGCTRTFWADVFRKERSDRRGGYNALMNAPRPV